MITLSEAVSFTQAALPGDAQRNLKDRCYVDLTPAILDRQAQRYVAVDSAGILQVRAAQFQADTVRVVLDLASSRVCQATLSSDPPRLQIAVGPPAEETPRAEATSEPERAVVGVEEEGSASPAVLVHALGAMSTAYSFWDPEKESPGGAFEGFQVQNPLFHPGMVDFHQRVNDGGETTNLALWTPVFRGGVGRIDLKHGPTLAYGGGFLRALAAAPDAGDLILAAQTVSGTGVEAWEAQGEYRLPTGVLLPGSLGVGGGYVSQDRFGPDMWFAKLSHRAALAYGWQTIASAQLQEVGQRTSPGGYLALYNTRLMFTGGTDGEQWRTTVGYVHPATGRQFRPAFEFFYVDETIGDGNGGKFLLATATLGYGGWGFLSHDSRLGRALGPQGLAFTNPNGFLQPMWNRLFDVTEVGGLLNGRVTEIRDAAGITSREWQLIGFPFQFASGRSWYDWFFIGGGLRQMTRQPDAPYLIGGAIGQLGAVRLLAGGHWDFERDEARLLLTVQYFL